MFKKVQITLRRALRSIVARASKARRRLYNNRPHRSFKRTYRRDYRAQVSLPGYIHFTGIVLKALALNKRTFGLLLVTYASVMFILGGVTSQATYTQIADLFTQSSGTEYTSDNSLVQGGLLLAATFFSGPSSLTVDQQIYLGFTLLLVWLTTVWLHREYLLGRKPKLRDGLYNSGAPVVSSIVVLMFAVFQLIPIGIVALVYSGLQSVGILSEGFSLMLFMLFALAVTVLSLYWLTSTFIAFAVVTLPGMYPYRAIRIAGDIVIGRRLPILFRLLWAQLLVILAWAVIFIPLILLYTWASDFIVWLDDVPVLPVIASALSAATIIWGASYIYLLYRRIVDDAA